MEQVEKLVRSLAVGVDQRARSIANPILLDLAVKPIQSALNLIALALLVGFVVAVPITSVQPMSKTKATVVVVPITVPQSLSITFKAVEFTITTKL